MNTSNGRSVREWDIPWNNRPVMEALTRCKFITVDSKRHGVLTFIFRSDYQHNQMYQTRFGGKGIISAGFITYDRDNKDRLRAEGMSTSIEGFPHATDEDTVTINEFLQEKLNESASN